MHELSLARDIVEIVYQNVPSNAINKVKSVVVKLGQFSGVVADSLKFSYSAITSQTDLEKSELEIIDIPFELKCHSCEKITSNEFGMSLCIECGSPDTEILCGNELEVLEVRVSVSLEKTNVMEEIT